MIRSCLVVPISDASDERRMTFAPSPVDCLALSLEGAENMVSTVFDDVVLAGFGVAVRPGVNVDSRHILYSR